jgi:hypothetical protein
VFTNGGQLVRFILVIALAVGAFVFFVAPTRYTVDELHETIVHEHGLQVATFGDAPAERVLERFGRYRRIGDGGAVGDSGSDPTTGFLRSEYGRSLGALLLLSLYRVSAFVELLPLVLPFLVVFMVDGLVTRSVRALEFVPHSAGIYGAAYLGLVTVFSFTVVAMSLPVLVHPMLFALAPFAAAVLAGRAAANFHKQG